MKITKIKVGLSELRKTEEYENQRFNIELEADISETETPGSVQRILTDQVKAACSDFFEESIDPADLKDQLRRYRREYGKLD